MLKHESFLFGNTAVTLGLSIDHAVFEKLIYPNVKNFFAIRGVSNFKILENCQMISDVDFYAKDFFSYFYLQLLDDISREADGSIDFSVKYMVTLDKLNCSKQCDVTQIYYDEITMANKVVMYFIYVDINSILYFLRNNSSGR